MKIMAFGAHPDDVEIGAGGLLAKLVQQGCTVEICVVTQPDNEIRYTEARNAAAILGASLCFLDFMREDLHDRPRLVKLLTDRIDCEQPEMVITHSPIDHHQDHNHISQAVSASCRHQKALKLLFFQSPYPFNLHSEVFQPRFYSDISDVFQLKCRSIAAHKSQAERLGNIEFAEHRAKLHGSAIGVDFAEAYEVIRWVI